jgi:NAD(P)H-hydrate epimerase
MQELPDKLYRVASIVQLEQIAIEKFDIPAYDLMKRAAQAVFDTINSRYPQCKKILVLCGAGNNAGDGYVVARLARQHGYDVQVISLIDPENLSGAALSAYNDWSSTGGVTQIIDSSPDVSVLGNPDIIVDALLGTGLKRQLSEHWGRWIKAVNNSAVTIVSVDVPSGLFVDTGNIADEAIHADLTVCFIGLKQGMFTAQANDYCGEIIFSDLDLPREVFSMVKHDARLLKSFDGSRLPARKPSSHKGRFGHVLIVGGNEGMPGAVILAARAALRTGAGLVTIITIPQHLSAISDAVPEAMIKACSVRPDDSFMTIESLFEQAFVKDVTHIAIGMGLGRDEWAKTVMKHCIDLKAPAVYDADALNLLAENEQLISKISSETLVITPHPGEAASLLSAGSRPADGALSAADIQNDRFKAISNLYELFELDNLVVVLKGAGTLIFNGDETRLCKLGNAAMSAPGMGDVLSGIIIALQAQSIAFDESAELGVCLHASAAQNISGQKTRGLLASDVIEELSAVLN